MVGVKRKSCSSHCTMPLISGFPMPYSWSWHQKNYVSLTSTHNIWDLLETFVATGNPEMKQSGHWSKSRALAFLTGFFLHWKQLF